MILRPVAEVSVREAVDKIVHTTVAGLSSGQPTGPAHEGGE
jgi:hypothetical protein